MRKFVFALSVAALPIAAPGLQPPAAYAAPAPLPLGDLSSFDKIARDTLALVDKGDLVAARKRITDFETAWDAAQNNLYHKDKAAWGIVDDAADKAISSLRTKKRVAANAKVAVANLIAAIRKSSTA